MTSRKRHSFKLATGLTARGATIEMDGRPLRAVTAVNISAAATDVTKVSVTFECHPERVEALVDELRASDIRVLIKPTVYVDRSNQ
jgi:hypothetical protein